MKTAQHKQGPEISQPGSGCLNWFISLLAGIGCSSVLALACAFVAIKLLPEFFESMGDQNQTMLKILTVLMVLGAGRLVFVLVRDRKSSE